jgi:hypothetical protein
VIATNAHVIEGAASGTAKLVGEGRKLAILGSLGMDRRADLALLSVNSDAPPLNLDSSKSAGVGDRVYVIGNPLGLEGTFSEGIVSGIRTIDGDSVLQMTAPISPGSSGGPVMNASGLVIGISVATFRNGQNLNLAIPVSYLAKLVGSLSPGGTPTPLSHALGSDAGRKSIVDEVGNRSESGVKASRFEFTGIDLTFERSGIQLRLTNQLPSSVWHVHVRVIYYDVSKAIMDFEDVMYEPLIPPGLTKTVVKNAPWSDSNEAGRAAKYYFNHKEDGSGALPWESHMTPKVEMRVIGFEIENAE